MSCFGTLTTSSSSSTLLFAAMASGLVLPVRSSQFQWLRSTIGLCQRSAHSSESIFPFLKPVATLLFLAIHTQVSGSAQTYQWLVGPLFVYVCERFYRYVYSEIVALQCVQ